MRVLAGGRTWLGAALLTAGMATACRSPLIGRAGDGDLETVRSLLDGKADPNVTAHGLAVLGGRTSVVALLDRAERRRR